MDENLETQVEEVNEVSMDTTIADAWKEIQSRGQVDRDDAGKFAAKEVVAEIPQEAAKDIPVEKADTQTEEQPETPSIKPPSSWKKEAQAKFATLPPDIQSEVMRREADMHKGIEGYKQNADKAQRYDRAFAPFMETIQKIGATPEQAISGLMQTDQTLRYGSPAQKVATVQRIIQEYGIKPEWFGQEQPQVNPEVGYLQNELQAIKAQQAAWQQELQSREIGTLNSDIETFAKNPENEHFEVVRDRMADLLQGGAAKNLKDAYDMAIWADPTIRASMLAKQQADERAKADAKAKEAKKASSVNVRSRGVIPAAKPLGTMDETIRAAAKELGMY